MPCILSNEMTEWVVDEGFLMEEEEEEEKF